MAAVLVVKKEILVKKGDSVYATRFTISASGANSDVSGVYRLSR
jgi:hypothetical protein